MRISEYFVKYDDRRDKLTILPLGVVVIFLAVILLLGAVFGTWKALTTKVEAVQAQIPATATRVPGQPSDTSTRPINWTITKAEDMGGGVVRYALPPEIEQMAIDDFNEAWQWGIDHVLDYDTLKTYAPVYYTDKWLERRMGQFQRVKEYHRVAVPVKEDSPPYGLPYLQIEGVTTDGKTLYIKQTLGARDLAFLKPDGTIDESKEHMYLSAEVNTYRMVFSDKYRRWQIAELVQGPTYIPSEGDQ